MGTMELWTFTVAEQGRQVDLTGFDVEAADGSIGKIDEATYETGQSSIVVDTGFWIFGKKRVLPAGVIDRIDLDDEKVYVKFTKDQIKNAPDYDADTWGDDKSRKQVGDYYDKGYAKSSPKR